MKKIRITALILLLIMSLTSCDISIPSTDNNNDPGTSTPGDSADNEIGSGKPDNENTKPTEYNNPDITFDIGETVVVVASEEKVDDVYILQDIATDITGVPAFTVTDDMPEYANELVFGRCQRMVSIEAYNFLEGRKRDNNYISRIAFYSKGNSVAIAFDDVPGYENYVFNYVIDLFKSKYITAGEALNMPDGELYIEELDLTAYQKGLDAELEAKAWADFEEKAGPEATAALRTMYETIYTDDIITWLAGIYDIETGGFYFANSTRDNEQTYIDGSYYDLLPDIESTDQALEFIRMSGMLGSSTLKDALPEWMRMKLIKFVKEKQDENGYFYHPQWTQAMVDSELSRRGRDLSKAITTLNQLGAYPTYDTPTGIKGDGMKWDGTPVSSVRLTMPMDTSQAVAVSLILPTAASTYPAHMENKTAFESYLESLNDDMARDSYWVGNQLASQADQIKARDAELKASGADYSLSQILKTWLDSKCYSTTGHWSSTPDYPGLNGFLKISATYQSLGLELPYPEAAARSAVDSIELSGRYPTACFAYNSWMSVSIIINNVQKHKSASDADRIIKSIRSELHERAPELIEVTMRKQGAFLMEDGSFMYIESGSSGKSQNLPISIPGVIEGTMNSTLLCTTGTVSHMLAALGYPTVPLFYRSDFNDFISILESKMAENN